MLSMGGRVVSPDLAEQIVKKFLETPFEGGRQAVIVQSHTGPED